MNIKFLLILFSTLITIEIMTNQNNKRSFKAIIFDMDGTVIDTETIWEKGNRHILTTYASHLTTDQIDEIIYFRKGIRTPDELAKMLQSHCSPLMSIAQIRELKTSYVFHLYETEGVSFIAYFHEFHNMLSTIGLKSAIATNATQKSIEALITKTPLRNYFNEHIYTIDTVNSNYKPSPDIYLHAAKMLGVDPTECIAIEDTEKGIKAAKAAGMYCIGINTGKNRALLAQADEIVDCFSEIDVEKLLNL